MDSLYVHVPFCRSICFYCDFKRGIYNENKADAWLDRILEDINLLEENFATIYVGGGTPSALNEMQFSKLFYALSKHLKKEVEFSVESNMESLTNKKIEIMKHAGVNRISLGVQSLQTSLLKMMNRKHTKEDVFKKIEQLYHQGITNISVDLIYGFEKQTLEEWESDLHEIASCPYISHVSLYSLTIEEGSVFAKQNQKTCGDELEGLMYEKAIEILKQYGFLQYEIANFAKIGYESKHNQTYWKYNDFCGIGVGASGKDGNIRYSIEGSVEDYIQHQESIEKEVLDIQDMKFEQIMMSLRMRKGMHIPTFNERYHCDFEKEYHTAIQKELKNHNIMIKDDYISTTIEGMFHLHDVLLSFMD